MGKALGIALANLINIFNFPLYLLSGGPLPAWDFFAPTMFFEISKRSFTYKHSGARVEKALLGADAGLFGAAYLPLRQAGARAAWRGTPLGFARASVNDPPGSPRGATLSEETRVLYWRWWQRCLHDSGR